MSLKFAFFDLNTVLSLKILCHPYHFYNRIYISPAARELPHFFQYAILQIVVETLFMINNKLGNKK
jgi:hypothetical protein